MHQISAELPEIDPIADDLFDDGKGGLGIMT